MSDLIERLESENHLSQFDGFDALIATGKEAAARIRVLEEALRHVNNPLGYLQEQAEREGSRLSGAAYAIANDLGFVQQIARKALGDAS